MATFRIKKTLCLISQISKDFNSEILYFYSGGNFNFENNSSYQNNLPPYEGFGTETWPDGACYTGNYKYGKRQGHGEFKWSDGSVYTGCFINNHMQGHGRYIWGDGKQFTGNWKQSKMHGKGIFTWPSGRTYEGEYK